MKKLIRDYLIFNRKERNGILFLLGVLTLLLVGQPLLLLLPGPKQGDTTEFEAEIKRYYTQVAHHDSLLAVQKAQKFKDYRKKSQPKPAEYFPFNPNHIASEEWKKMGLKEWQIKSLNKYLSKGGQFRKKSDLRKMYAIDSVLYSRLEPFIQLPDTLPRKAWKNKEVFEKKEIPPASIALNKADTNQLKALKGIGKVLSSRIVEYREELGGFYKLEQLKEVFGLPPETIEKIESKLVLDTTLIKKIDLNTATIEELWNHPYIRWNLAKVIVAYRGKHGPFLTVGDVRNTDLVNADLYVKIAPYLAVSSDAY